MQNVHGTTQTKKTGQRLLTTHANEFISVCADTYTFAHTLLRGLCQTPLEDRDKVKGVLYVQHCSTGLFTTHFHQTGEWRHTCHITYQTTVKSNSKVRQVRHRNVQLSSRPSTVVPHRPLHTSVRRLITAASLICYSVSLDGSVMPAQHTRSTGLLCGRPVTLELSTRQLVRSGSWQGQLQKSEDTLIYNVLKHSAY